MKKFFNKAKNKANEMAIKAKTTLDNARAESYIDTGVKIIMGKIYYFEKNNLESSEGRFKVRKEVCN